MPKEKVLTENGVRRLWAAIESKFVDLAELDDILEELPAGTTDMVALTNSEIDEITGYTEPTNDDPQEPDNTDP